MTPKKALLDVISLLGDLLIAYRTNFSGANSIQDTTCLMSRTHQSSRNVNRDFQNIKSISNFLFLNKALLVPNSASPSSNVFSARGLVASSL